MNKWLALDPIQLQRSQEEFLGGVTVEVYLSPYDIPEAIGRHDDQDKNKCIIEFRYIDKDESLTPRVHDNNITLVVGKRSGRIYRIEIEGCDPSRVSLHMRESEIENAFNRLTQNKLPSRNLNNYKLIQDILTHQGKELFSPIKCTSNNTH